MRSKRTRSKKGKSKVDKIKRKSRRKVNSQTKMKKKTLRKTRVNRKTHVNRRSFIRKTKRRMRGGSSSGGEDQVEYFEFINGYLESIMKPTNESKLTENEKAIKRIILLGLKYGIKISELAIVGANENSVKNFIDKISEYVIKRIKEKRSKETAEGDFSEKRSKETAEGDFSSMISDKEFQKWMNARGGAPESYRWEGDPETVE